MLNFEMSILLIFFMYFFPSLLLIPSILYAYASVKKKDKPLHALKKKWPFSQVAGFYPYSFEIWSFILFIGLIIHLFESEPPPSDMRWAVVMMGYVWPIQGFVMICIVLYIFQKLKIRQGIAKVGKEKAKDICLDLVSITWPVYLTLLLFFISKIIS